MSKAQRLEARNAKIKQRQAEQATKKTVPVKHEPPSNEEIKTKLANLMAVYNEAKKRTSEFMKKQGVHDDDYVDHEAASYIKQEHHVVEDKSKLRFMPARTIRGKTREAHFAGPDSTTINLEYQKLKIAETNAYNAFRSYRSSYDKEWIASQQEMQNKSNVFRLMCNEEMKQPKKKMFEIIHLMHSNPLDKTSYVMCKHYDRETWEAMDCDCEKTYKCGCVESIVCRVHDVSLCECSTTQRINTSRISKCKEHNQDPTLWLHIADVSSFKRSLRANARLAQSKLALASFGATKIKVVRNSAGSILLKNKDGDGKMNEEGVRCYHSIIPTGDMIPCDCIRDVNNRFQLSEKMQKLPKDDVVLDETCLHLQRQLVDSSPSEQEYFLNPSGFAGSLRPEFGPVHPSKVAQEKAILEQAVKMHVFK